MIGRSLEVQDTGAPHADEPLRRKLHNPSPADVRRRSFTGLRRQLAGSWQPQPIRFWREFAAFALFLMGLSWAVPWFRSLSQAVQGVSAAGSLLILTLFGLAAYVTARVLNGFRISPKGRRIVLGGLLVASVLIGLRTLLYAKEVIPVSELVLRPLWAFGNYAALIPNEWIVVGAVLLVWRRGAVLALDYIGPGRVLEEFKAGFWMFLAFTFFITFVSGREVEFDFLLLFLTAGLLAMGAARMASVSELRGGTRGAFDRQRLLAMVLGGGLAAFFAYRTGLAFAADGGALAGFVLGSAVVGAFLVTAPVLLAILYGLYAFASIFQEEAATAFDRLLALVDGLLSLLEGLKGALRELGILLADRFIFLKPIFAWLISLAPGLRIFVLLAVLVLLAALVYTALAIRARKLRALAGVDDADGLGLDDFLARLRRSLLERLRSQQESLIGALDLRRARQERLAARIRRIYAALIRLMEEEGVVRAAAETPREFQLLLAQRYPLLADDLAFLTDAYLRVRYGELPERRSEAGQAGAAFNRIRRAIRKDG